MNKKTNAGAQAPIPRLRMRHRALPLLLAGAFGLVSANPQNPQVVHGQATFQQQGNVFTITNTPNAIINWQNFSVGAGEITRFVQQGADSAVLNRITGQNPTQILGALQSNGRVFLINPNGVLFGANARVDVNGLVASSLQISNQDFLDGKHRFSAGDKAGAVRNEGAISTPAGGSVYLIAPDVNNSGVITTPKGDVVLAAGRQVELVDSRNPELHVVVAAPADQAVNLGQVVAQGGRIGIYGALVNQRGVVNANSAVVGENGKIVLKASGDTLLEQGSTTTATGVGRGGDIKVLGKQVGLTGNAQVDASGVQGGGSVMIGGDYLGQNASVPNAERTYVGNDAVVRADAQQQGDGGRVIVWANELTRFFGNISATGGSRGGNGGFVETSGKQTLEAAGNVRVGASNGARGTWLLDPNGITISTATGGLSNSGGIFSGGGSSFINNLALGNALLTGDVSLHSSANIEITAPVVFDSGGSFLWRALKLKAKDNIIFGAGGKLEAKNGAKLDVFLYAGAKDDFSTDEGGLRQSGVAMAAGSSILTNGGSIVAEAKKASSTTPSQVQLGTVSTYRAADDFYGDVNIKTKGGDVVQTGSWTVATTDLDLGEGSMRGNVTLENLSNQFNGYLSIENAGTVKLKSANSMVFGDVNTTGAMTVTARSLSQYGAFDIGGAASFTATGPGVESGDIIFNSSSNIFAGQVSATAGGQISLQSHAKPLKLGTITAPNADVFVYGSGININVQGTVSGNYVEVDADNLLTIESAGKLQAVTDAIAEGGSVTLLGTVTGHDARVVAFDAATIGSTGKVIATDHADVDAYSADVTISGSVTGADVAVTVETLNLGATGKLTATDSVYVGNSSADVTLSGAVTGTDVSVSVNNLTVESTGKITATDRADVGVDMTTGTLTNKGSITGDAVMLEAGFLKPLAGAIRATSLIRLDTNNDIILGGAGTSTTSMDMTSAQFARLLAPSMLIDNSGYIPALAPSASWLASGGALSSFDTNITIGSGGIAPSVTNLSLYTGGVVDVTGPITMPGGTIVSSLYFDALGGVTGSGLIKTTALAIYSENGIGTSAAPLQTDVSVVHLANDAANSTISLKNISATVAKLTVQEVIQDGSGTNPVTIQTNGDLQIGLDSTPGNITTSGDVTLVAGKGLTVKNGIVAGTGAIDLYAGYGAAGASAPITDGSLVVTGTLDSSGVKTLKAGGTVTTTGATIVGTPLVTGGPVYSGPTLADCIANKALTGCAAILPTVAQCQVAPSTSGCSVVLPPPSNPAPTPPTLSECVANPAKTGCGSVLPSIAQCVANPKAAGCEAVLPPVTTCAANPTAPGCEVVLPDVAACVANPKAPGCGSVLPPLAACVANPSKAGCSAVLPQMDICVSKPTTDGCAAVLPRLDVCIATPTAPGCTAVLPPLNVCVAQPQTTGCVAVLPTVGFCTANPQAPGCSQVLPKFDTCVASPTTPGCAAVLPSVSVCVANPTANGCAAVLPPLATCVATPSAAGCQAVLPKLETCLSNPAAVGCQAVLPSVSACVANKSAPGCAVVLPSVATCTATPSQTGCAVVLPRLETCVASPSMQGCSVVLPSVSVCAADPTHAGCTVVIPPTQAGSDTPVGQAVSSTVKVINSSTTTKVSAAPKPPRESTRTTSSNSGSTSSAGSSQAQAAPAAPAAGSGSGSAGAGAGEPGPAAGGNADEKAKEKQQDSSASADKGEVKNEPAKKMYCN